NRHLMTKLWIVCSVATKYPRWEQRGRLVLLIDCHGWRDRLRRPRPERHCLTREEKTVKAFKVVSRWSTLAAVAIGFALLPFAASADSDNDGRSRTVKVDCGKGDTIAKALQQGEERKPLVIVVRGVCNEIVSIPRDDVTLQADPVTGGAVNGGPPDPNGPNVITISGRRVTIDGLTVTGGRNGIQGEGASRLMVLNCVVQSGRTGVVFFQGSSGTVNNCTLDGNARDGVAIESASATVINSSMSNNGRLGVIVTDGGSGRIGVDNANLAGPNKINSNKSNGVQVTIGGTAFIGANDIIGNGTDPNAPTGRFGIFIVNATADIIGANNIKNNANHGVFARNASILIGDTSGSFNTFSGVNTISGNGTAVNNSAGVFGFVGTAMVVRNAAITGNNGFGLFLSLRSSAQISGNMIQNNIG